MIIKRVTTFLYGLITSIDEDTVPDGATVDALNWTTEGDKIELRRGYRILGNTSKNTGTGRATGIVKVVDSQEVDRLFGSYGKKVKYYNRTTEEFEEVLDGSSASDILGDDVIQDDGFGEDISFAEYTGLAGNQLWINSPNIKGFYKVMVANPLNAVDQYDAAKNYKGHIIIDTNRTFLWARNDDQTGLHGSFIDAQAYTTVSSEILGTGNASDVTFAGTLAFKAGGAKRTCFGVVVTDGVETFTDDFNGVLTGSEGGTGTINYATGAISVTFNTAVAGSTNVLVDYQWEDSTNDGIADFTESATRLAGEGFVFRQDEGGGKLQAVKNFKNIYYCFHTKKTWSLNLGDDDTTATNLPYRTLVGIPNLRAAVEVEDGIIYIDDSTENKPKLKKLSYSSAGSEEVEPQTLSDKLDLADYSFDRGACTRFGDYVLFACRLNSSEVNNRVLLFNTLFDSFDAIEYFVTDFAVYDRALVVADSIQDNFSEIFSGEDDDGNNILNYWISDLDDNNIEGLKKTKKFYIRGQINPDQKIKVYLSFDDGSFILVGEISGDGEYVDSSNAVNVGALTLGRGEIGGGGSGRVAYQYERLFSIRTSKYERVKVKFEATQIGYASVAEYGYWDIRFKGQKVPLKYRG